MKSLKESIISSNNAGGFKFKPTMIANKYTSSTLNDVFDMKKMYADAEKLSGVKPNTHADAFEEILCGPDMIFHQDDIKKLINLSWAYIYAANDLIDKILKEKFKDYIKPNVKFNFFWNELSYKKSRCYGLGVLIENKKGRYIDKPILDLILK